MVFHGPVLLEASRPRTRGGSPRDTLSVHPTDDSIAKVRARLKKVAERLPVTADSGEGRAQNGRPYVDLPAPLSLVLGPEEDATVRPGLLLEHVTQG